MDDFTKAQAYVGRAYIPDLYDCGHFYVDLQRDVFGRSISIPHTHRKGRMGQAAQIRKVRDGAFTRIDEPEHGCAVLMVAGDIWHIGTMFRYNGTWWICHNSRAIGGVALQKIRDLRGQRIEGFYKYDNAS